ncbi:MAG: hypothetical protein ABIG28_01790 [archaeon]
MELKTLEQYPIITKAIIKKIVGCDDSYAYTVLTRLLKRKKIKQIIKGKYTTGDNVYIIATNLFSPSYLSFWSCSSFKGYTEQILNTVQIATTKPIREIDFENYTINFEKMPKKMFFGYEKKAVDNNNFIFVAEDEKLVIDAIYHEELMGNFDEIVKVIESSDIEVDKLLNYLKEINNKSLTKRVGFLVERFRGVDFSKKIKYKDKNIVSLSGFIRNKKINKKWQVKHDL